MYIVIQKKTKKIIHVNSTPLIHGLSGKEVYHKFNPRSMEIGGTDAREVPERFTINKEGDVVEPTLEELVKDGTIVLRPEEKVSGNEILRKTVSELVKEGQIALSPTQKIVGMDSDEKIVDKTLSEQIKEGIFTLPPTQKIVGPGENEQIVDKTMSEQVAEGIIKIDEPFESVVDDAIVRNDVRDLIRKRALKTRGHGQIALKLIDAEIEREISGRYTPGLELNTTKDFLDWMNEGKPTNDPREKAYGVMQKTIGGIKAEYRKLKEQIETRPVGKKTTKRK